MATSRAFRMAYAGMLVVGIVLVAETRTEAQKRPPFPPRPGPRQLNNGSLQPPFPYIARFPLFVRNAGMFGPDNMGFFFVYNNPPPATFIPPGLQQQGAGGAGGAMGGLGGLGGIVGGGGGGCGGAGGQVGFGGSVPFGGGIPGGFGGGFGGFGGFQYSTPGQQGNSIVGGGNGTGFYPCRIQQGSFPGALVQRILQPGFYPQYGVSVSPQMLGGINNLAVQQGTGFAGLQGLLFQGIQGGLQGVNGGPPILGAQIGAGGGYAGIGGKYGYGGFGGASGGW